MTTKTILFLAAVGFGTACGGHNGGGTTTPQPDTHDPKPVDEHAETMVAPEKMDEITRDLDRKREIVSHCLAIAVDNKELPKNSHGKVTLEIVIAPSGAPQSVKVLNATLESKSLTDCVVGHVKTIEFPALDKPYETSYTYAFEAS